MIRLRVLFPTGQDSPFFGDKGTEDPSLSRDKGTTEQAQNLAKGRDGLRLPVKIQEGLGTRQYEYEIFSLSRPILQDETGQSRKGRSKTGKGRSKTRKRRLAS